MPYRTIWLFAAAPIVRERAAALQRPGIQIGITMAGTLLLVLLTSASGRAIYAMPLLPPLALIAVARVQEADGRLAAVLGKLALRGAEAAPARPRNDSSSTCAARSAELRNQWQGPGTPTPLWFGEVP